MPIDQFLLFKKHFLLINSSSTFFFIIFFWRPEGHTTERKKPMHAERANLQVDWFLLLQLCLSWPSWKLKRRQRKDQESTHDSFLSWSRWERALFKSLKPVHTIDLKERSCGLLERKPPSLPEVKRQPRLSKRLWKKNSCRGLCLSSSRVKTFPFSFFLFFHFLLINLLSQ